MAARREDLTEEQLARKRAYQRSWDVAQEFLPDPEKRSWLEASIERVRQSSAKPMTRESSSHRPSRAPSGASRTTRHVATMKTWA